MQTVTSGFKLPTKKLSHTRKVGEVLTHFQDLNPRLGGGRTPTPMTFSTVVPKRQYKVGVMGYIDLNYYIGKTPKQVLGLKIFLGPVQRPSKSDCRKILVP